MTSSRLKSDVGAIECTAEECSLRIEHTDDAYARVEYNRGVNVYVEKGAAKLVIKQKKGLLSRIFGGESQITVYVPGHIVPSLCIKGGKVDCAVDGGIYANVEFSAGHGGIKADGAAMESCTVNAQGCNISFAGCMVKGTVVTNVEEGDLSFENTFATHIAGRTKRGNIGAVKLNCKDTIFEAGEGNITANVLGDESTFDVIVNAKEGTCNRESLNIENNDASFKAYVVKGNIFVDFVSDEEN